MNMHLNALSIICGGLLLTNCAGVACLYDSTGYMIDYSKCTADHATRESQAYYEGRAKAQARKGSSYDKYALGEDYETGGLVSINESDGRWRGMTVTLKKSRRQAIYWYKEAIKQGGAGANKARDALIRLGVKPPETPASRLSTLGYEAHKKGDDVTAAQYWLEAAQRGDVSAQHNIGWAHDTGRGVEQNYLEAVRWYRLAAEQGNMRSQSALGEIFLFGVPGVAADMAAAEKYNRLAAEQGSPISQRYLGAMYEEGRGVPKNIDAAIGWYRKSAAHGDEEAQRALMRLGASS